MILHSLDHIIKKGKKMSGVRPMKENQTGVVPGLEVIQGRRYGELYQMKVGREGVIKIMFYK